MSSVTDKYPNADLCIIRENAEHLFRSGQLYCSEAVMKALRDAFCPEVPDLVISMMSGFPVGMGSSGCICGAVAGGVAFLGLMFGRAEHNDVLKSEHCMRLAHELHDMFRKKHGSICCRVLTKGLVFGSSSHSDQCIRFSGEVAEVVAEMVLREQNVLRESDLGELTSESKVTDILSVKPEAAEVFIRYGMTCLASVIARGESLAVAVTHKNLPLDDICRDIGIRRV
ncbi:MAG TPA: C-GCAxxG-C-C family protein [Methanocorpusculum sp.]|nr:C-GCAxxG-C-C family protein [Methanocorpusculum sp.]